MIKQLLTISFLLAIASNTVATENSHHHMSNSDSMMKKSMASMHGMHNLKLTGNPDYDFIAGMIPHHQGAIVMSEESLKTLSDKRLKKLAKAIIDSQKKEIAFMSNWLKNSQPKVVTNEDMAASKEMMQQTMIVMQEMHEIPLTGNMDKDFAQGMIPHHEAAVVMAKVVLPYLKDEKVKAFAQEVISVQNKEIAQMNTWLKELS